MSNTIVSPEGEVCFELVKDQGPQAIAQWLAGLIGKPIRVTFTNNRSTMFSWREVNGCMRLRIHKMFAQGAEGLWVCLAHYLVYEDTISGKIIDDYIAENIEEYNEIALTKQQPIGRYHDLYQLFSRLNEEFFHNRCVVKITWGRTCYTSRRPRKSIQLGSYVAGEQLIRIHPCLDQAWVPHYYVAWVIYHEMLHEVFGTEVINGRRRIHPPEFLIMEQSYPDYGRCKLWEENNLGKLLRYRASKISSHKS